MVYSTRIAGGVRPDRIIRILTAFFLLTILAPRLSYGSEWQRLSPEGLAVHDYCSAMIGDVFCTDTGLTIGFVNDWEDYSYGNLPARAVLPLNDDTLLVALGDSSFSDGVYRFVESTGQFENLAWFVYPNFLIQKGNQFYLGGDQGLLVSDDGLTWNEVEYFQFTRCVAMAAWGDHLAVAVTGNVPGVYTSDDGGETWNAPAGGSPLIERLAYGPDHVLYGIYPGDSRSSGMWESQDFGATWRVSVYSTGMTANYMAGGHITVGWEADVPMDNCVSLWNEGTGELVDITGNLPTCTVERFSENMMIDCINVVACTDSGAYLTCNLPDLGVVEGDPLPFEFLLSVHPTPFNQEATLTLALPMDLPVSIRLYDVLGRHVRTVVQETLRPGMHRWTLDAAGLSSGVYFLHAEVREQVRNQKVLLLR